MLFEILKDCRDFVAELEVGRCNATHLYSTNDYGLRLLIPDGRNIHGAATFTRVVIVRYHELSSKMSLDALAHIANRDTKDTFIEKCARSIGMWANRISQTVYVFLVEKMIGTFHSRRRGNDIFLFFNTSKLTEIQIKFRLMKILGRLFVKRAERIVESTIEKIGKEPFGYLAEIVKFFTNIGKFMLRKAVRYFRSIEDPLPREIKIAIKRARKLSYIINNAIRVSLYGNKMYTSNYKTSGSNSNSNFDSIEKVRVVDDSVKGCIDELLEDVLAYEDNYKNSCIG